MPIVSEAVLEFARDRFRDLMENLLDDPSNLLHPLRDLEPVEELKILRDLAADLGLDYEALVAEGTPYEIKRLAEIEAGIHKPAPRQS
jgi:hypothetical protein